MNPSDSLQEAIAAIKSGDKATGQKLLLSLLKSDPKNETALLWLSKTTDDPAKKRTCLERVLVINPNNEQAKKALADLQSKVVEAKKTDPEAPSLMPRIEQRPNTPKPLKVIESIEATKKCPYCAETIKGEATVCRFCGRDLVTGQLPGQPQPIIIQQSPQKKGSNPLLVMVLLLAVLCGIFILYSALSPLITNPSRRAINTPSGPAVTPQVFEFSGRGDDTITLTLGRAGRVDFSISHRGESNFAVEILDRNGELEDLVVNEIGDYNGNRSVSLSGGEHIIQITADGGWGMVVTVQ